jgi:hypothetical protein
MSAADSMGLTTFVNRPIGLLKPRGGAVIVRSVERDALISTRLFVAASFIAFCVVAVALLGTAV